MTRGTPDLGFQSEIAGFVTAITATAQAVFYLPTYEITPVWRHPMSADFVNWTSRAAISARVADCERQSRGWDDWLPGDYHLPFSRAEARAEAAKWIWQP